MGIRIFVRHKRGAIVAVCKARVTAADVEHPFGDVGEGEDVVEVPGSAEIDALEAHEIVEQFSVDTRNKRLRKRRR